MRARHNELKNPYSLAKPVCEYHHKCVAFVVIELLLLVRYSALMASKSLFQQNPHLRNAQDYQRALRANVLSSTAIEGVKKAAERALPPISDKPPAKTR